MLLSDSEGCDWPSLMFYKKLCFHLLKKKFQFKVFQYGLYVMSFEVAVYDLS